MDKEIRTFDDLYRHRYKDNITGDKEREKMVGELMMLALQNDSGAVKRIVELMIDPSFAVVKNALLEKGELYHSIEIMEDMMQEVPEIIMKLFFRGIPEKVTEAELLKYLLGAVKNGTRQKLQKHYEKEAKNPSLDKWKEDGMPLPKEVEEGEEKASEEEDSLKDDMISYYIKCLMDTKTEPHKAVTYGYATLLPIVFKSTQNEQVLQEMDVMSGRFYHKKTSSYRWNPRKERFELTGEIARDSMVLMKWAVDAMCKLSVDFLQKEMEETYNMEPIGNTTFVWGDDFRKNLLKEYDEDRKEKEVVITSEFSEVNMKNWPVRMSAVLYKETRKHFMNEEYYTDVASRYGR